MFKPCAVCFLAFFAVAFVAAQPGLLAAPAALAYYAPVAADYAAPIAAPLAAAPLAAAYAPYIAPYASSYAAAPAVAVLRK